MSDDATTDAPADDAPPADAAADNAAEAAVEEPAAEEAVPEREPDELRDGIVERFSELLGDALVATHVDPGVDLTVRVTPEAWLAAADVARNRLGARYFCFLSAIDWLPSPFGRSMDSDVDIVLAARAGDVAEPPSSEIQTGTTGGDTRFQVLARVAHVGGGDPFWGVTLKADVPEDTLTVDSWVSVYAGADWHERECWEMFGLTFAGHPGLRHMYLPGDFEGYPLRKDYPLLSRMVKPWPGIVDVEPMPSDDEPEGGSSGEEGSEG